MVTNSLPARTPKLAERLARPFVRFMELEIASAVLLMAASVFALLWSNSPWGAHYFELWSVTKLSFQLGTLQVSMTLGEWVNDGLMVIFFFAVGMEIKREMVSGELSSREKAMLPVLGAVGGMVVPAGIYLMFHLGGPAERGWGVPMATDIAFAIAALSVFGRRVPPGLRIFLLALSIADDLGAVAVIAVFYTAELHLDALALAGAGLALCVLLNVIGVRAIAVYVRRRPFRLVRNASLGRPRDHRRRRARADYAHQVGTRRRGNFARARARLGSNICAPC